MKHPLGLMRTLVVNQMIELMKNVLINLRSIVIDQPINFESIVARRSCKPVELVDQLKESIVQCGFGIKNDYIHV